MSSWRRVFRLDGFDTAVHVGVTVILALLLASKDPVTQKLSDYLILGGVSLLLYAFRRRIAFTIQDSTDEPSGVHAVARPGELDALYARIAELEERQDFSERLIARRGEPMRSEGPR
jgi:hypothetical protein